MKARKSLFSKNTGLDFNRKRAGRRIGDLRPLVKLLTALAIAVGGGFLVAFLFFTGLGVNGVSMSPTLNDGNRVFINRFITKIAPRLGDVVAFSPDSGNPKNISIKRIVALPGDTVVIQNGTLYINGKKENTNLGFETEVMTEAGMARNEIFLGEGEYFLLGDNRNNSEDSRFESVGNVKKSDIIGKVWLCYSLDNFRLMV